MKSKKTWLLLALIFLVTLVKILSQGFFLNYRLLFVNSSSMEPLLPLASVLLEKEVSNVSELADGDVITYRRPNETPGRVTHRIVSINRSEKTVITKGDANQTSDKKEVDFALIEGRVIGVYPYTIQTLAGLVFVAINLRTLKRFLERKNDRRKINEYK